MTTPAASIVFLKWFDGQPRLPNVGRLVGRAVPVLMESADPEGDARAAAREALAGGAWGSTGQKAGGMAAAAAGTGDVVGLLWDTEGGPAGPRVEFVSRLAGAAAAVAPGLPQWVFELDIPDDVNAGYIALADSARFQDWRRRRLAAPRVRGAGLAFGLYPREGITLGRWAADAAVLMNAYRAMGLPALAVVSSQIRGKGGPVPAADFAFMLDFVRAQMGAVGVWADGSPWATAGAYRSAIEELAAART